MIGNSSFLPVNATSTWQSSIMAAQQMTSKLDEYNFLQVLGSGAFGKVYKVSQSAQIVPEKALLRQYLVVTFLSKISVANRIFLPIFVALRLK